MNHADLALHLMDAYKARIPVMIWGEPGIGKSAVVNQTTSALSVLLNDCRASQLDPVDLRGIPRIDALANMTRFVPPSFLPRDGAGILFLDEINAAPLAVQVACYQLILDRRLGDYVLPDGWTVFAAGNREKDRAAAARMSTALKSRFIHYELTLDPEVWFSWAVKNGIAPEIVAGLRFRPQLIQAFDPLSAENAYPCCRTWEMASKLLKASRYRKPAETLAAAVGTGAAAELAGFISLYSTLPPLESIYTDPQTADVPTSPAALFAIAGALARSMGADSPRTTNAIAYLQRLPVEYQVVTIREMGDLQSPAINSASFIRWAVTVSGVTV